MTRERNEPASMGDLDQSIHGYINTSVDTLTVEMDR